jgi:hypothetical protein
MFFEVRRRKATCLFVKTTKKTNARIPARPGKPGFNF